MASNHAMLAMLLQVLMMIQGLPALSTPGGTVTGELKDVDGIQLAEVPVVPAGFRSAAIPDPAGTHSPGTSVPLATLRGHIVEADTRNPITNGTVFVVGDHWATCSIDADGKFEVRNLLPGSYSLELRLVGYPTTRRTITVGEEDVSLELAEP